MTSVRALKAVAGAGDIDPSQALRIDVIRAAEAFIDAQENWESDDCPVTCIALGEAQQNLEQAVSRMRRARQRRAL